MIVCGLQKAVNIVPWRWRSKIRRIPVVARLQHWMIARYLEGREFVHTVDAGPARGLNFPIKMPDDKGIWTGTYELELAKSIADAVQCGEVCVDVGGWHGFFSEVMALAGSKRVIVFEPFPDNCLKIQRMIDLNPRLHIELHSVALGAQESIENFCVMSQSSMGKLANSRFQFENRGEHTIQIPVTTLDDLWRSGKIDTPSTIKVDVEGAEVCVLQGSLAVLMCAKPKLFIEVHSHELGLECFRILTEIGYSVKVLETQLAPDGESEPDVCHFVALAHNGPRRSGRIRGG